MSPVIDEQTALILIDLQKGIFNMDWAHPVQDVLMKLALLADAFRKAGWTVVVVNMMPMGFYPKGFADIVDDIHVCPTDVFITKKYWGAFYKTSLHQELQKRKITKVLLSGVATSKSVESTGHEANKLGYNVSFATDAMTDKSMEAHLNSVNHTFARLGLVITTNDWEKGFV